MQVVLLAAGLGSRLGTLTEALPKALITVAGEPLLAHAVRFANRLRPTEIVVVGGFGFPAVAAEIARRRLDVRLVENPRFRDGNLVSLLAAKHLVHDDFLLMNVDHIYRPAIAERISSPNSEVTAFVDRDRALGADDMKVKTDGAGRIRAIAKTLVDYDCGYVGMTLVPRAAAARYWEAADAVLSKNGPSSHVERVLARLAEGAAGGASGVVGVAGGGSPNVIAPLCRDVSGVGWLEVDLPDERDHADATIVAAPDDWR